MTITIKVERDNSLSEHAKRLLRDFYMLEEETSPQEAYARAANAWSGGDKQLAQRLYDAASKNWFVFASPVLSNAPMPGKPAKGLPISCFLSYVGDNLHSLIDHTTETRWLSVKGGGVGGHWSDVRAVSDIAPGPIPFLHTLDSDMVAYKQGKTRKGSYAAYLDVSHPDIVEFIGLRIPTGDVNRKCLNLHHGINISDAFMDCVKCGTDWNLVDPKTKEVRSTVKARQLWETILETRYRTGEPYINFIDTANKDLPYTQKKLGLKIHGSNLCVAPETLILTSEGYRRIHSLKDKQVRVWNGHEWSRVTIKQTSTNSELIKISFSNGSTLDCTKEHKFYIQNAYGKLPEIKMAQELIIGDKLQKVDFETCPAFPLYETDTKYWYTSGFFTGDGCAYKGRNHIDLYGEKRKLKEHLLYEKEYTYCPKQDRQRIIIGYDHAKFFIPEEFNARVSWLSGLFDADGCIVRNGDNEALQLASINRDFLVDLMLAMQELGITSKVVDAALPCVKSMPDGQGGHADYNCKQSWRILVSSVALQDMINLGVKFNRLKVSNRQPQRKAEAFVQVTSTINEGRKDSTFCCTEPLRHAIVVNGVLSSQCNEIHLPTSEERTAVCCLSSLNLEYYDEWRNTNLVADLVRMLDNVLDYFIEHAPKELSKAAYSAQRERAIGLGAMGFHSYLQRRNIAFESREARTINDQIFYQIKEEAVKESQALAHEKGEAPDMEGTGLRNSHLLAIAPNANSSIIADTAPSIEPWHGNAFVHRTRAGSFLSRNKYLEKALNEINKNTDDVWSSIISNGGSVKHLAFLDEAVKSVFKTASEINQEWVINHAADRQKYICQGQSVNLFFSANANRKHINKVHLMAHEKGLKGLYYLRTEASSKAENVGEKVERVALKDAETCAIDDAECKACMV